MNKNFLFFVLGILFLFSLSFVSATLCQNAQGYYDDCDYPALRYHEPVYYDDYEFTGYDYAPKPIFKGSYGNYRYVKYLNGDDNPTDWFTSYGIDGYNGAFIFGGGNYFPGGYGYGSPFFGSGYFWSDYDYGYNSYDYGYYHLYKQPAGYYESYDGYDYGYDCGGSCLK